MVDIYLVECMGRGSGPAQFFIQPLPRTFSPGTERPDREGNTLLPKLKVGTAAIPLPHRSSRPAAELNMGISLPSFLMVEYDYRFSEFMGKNARFTIFTLLTTMLIALQLLL